MFRETLERRRWKSCFFSEWEEKQSEHTIVHFYSFFLIFFRYEVISVFPLLSLRSLDSFPISDSLLSHISALEAASYPHDEAASPDRIRFRAANAAPFFSVSGFVHFVGFFVSLFLFAGGISGRFAGGIRQWHQGSGVDRESFCRTRPERSRAVHPLGGRGVSWNTFQFFVFIYLFVF